MEGAKVSFNAPYTRGASISEHYSSNLFSEHLQLQYIYRSALSVYLHFHLAQIFERIDL